MEHSSPPPPSLGLCNASHTIKKPPLPPKFPPPRHPVIIHDSAPKIIRVRPENFKAVVQRLTGAPTRANYNPLSPPSQTTTIQKKSGQEGPTIDVGSGPRNKPAGITWILPPVFPASLPPIPHAYFVPTFPSLLYRGYPVEPVYRAGGNFLVRPGNNPSLPVVSYSGGGNLLVGPLGPVVYSRAADWDLLEK
ncbi:hypothetical protein KFK09_013865 [Dendrobium nobile]|uniref:VQ domain-containing protein n=1 Tax=Dendrobium nobile TaxID=94219 RepID=A0A8T3B8L5_DENNO|nr:hypothetical protein KFK09_013865 [Dendrobium nobile]